MPPVLTIQATDGESLSSVPPETAQRWFELARQDSRSELIDRIVAYGKSRLSPTQAATVATLVADGPTNGWTDFNAAAAHGAAIVVAPSGLAMATWHNGRREFRCLLRSGIWTVEGLPKIRAERLIHAIDGINEHDPELYLHFKLGRKAGAN